MVVVTVLTGWPGTVVGVVRWWCRGAVRMAVTWEPGSAADADTTPNRPRAQMAVLRATAQTATQPTGFKVGHRHWCCRILSHWRPSAPWRTGCSMYRHDRAAITRVAAIWRMSRTRLGAALAGVVSTMIG